MRDYPLVTPKFEREPDNAPGPFYVVKNECILCAMPPEVAPQNIRWDAEFQRTGCVGCPNHCRVERQPQTADEVERVIQAACASCVEAIRYCGTDPEILARFRAEGLERLCDAL
jgi:Na+-translocating ferredoxin:NAD+ oxidoreductase RNF subunit RnfB